MLIPISQFERKKFILSIIKNFYIYLIYKHKFIYKTKFNIIHSFAVFFSINQKFDSTIIFDLKALRISFEISKYI